MIHTKAKMYAKILQYGKKHLIHILRNGDASTEAKLGFHSISFAALGKMHSRSFHLFVPTAFGLSV